MNRVALQIIRDEHASVAAVLRSLLQMVEQGPQDAPLRFFDVMRAMLYYTDESTPSDCTTRRNRTCCSRRSRGPGPT